MLTGLIIQNVVLIEKLSLRFDAGLNVLTGETGAGKSILLDSLGLVIGARADSALVRKGAEEAKVAAEFDLAPGHPAFAFLEEQALEAEPGEPLIVRRVVSAEGRSKAFVNDQPASAKLLRALGELLVEIHGQFDTHDMLKSAAHLELLDSFGGYGRELAALAAAAGRWKDAAAARDRAQAQAEAAEDQQLYLQTALEDLDAFDPKEGEEAELARAKERLQRKDTILNELNTVYELGENALAATGKLWRSLDKIGADAAEISAEAQTASASLETIAGWAQDLSAALGEDGQSLEEIDERLYGLRREARKHNCTPDDLPAKRAELAAQLSALENRETLLADLEVQVQKARAAYIAAADTVRGQRKKAAAKLDKAVQGELAPLKLDKARFVTALDELPESRWGAAGRDQAAFLVATNPGAEPAPLERIASGGELARFMLALKVVLARAGSAETMIFDEVDTGIGGATAQAVGERMARLGQAKQVLAVTHSPQVAAQAAHHFVVRKESGRTARTLVELLADDAARLEELARMLSGEAVTDAARAAALELRRKAA